MTIALLDEARAVTDGETILASVEIDAPPKRVIDALTTDEVERWWGAPDVYAMRRWRSDRRVGGPWQVDVCMPDGSTRPASGEFLVVEVPNLIRITRRYDWDHPTIGHRATTVTYRCETLGSGTRVTVRHEDFGAPQTARDHTPGWENVLNWLKVYLTDCVGRQPDTEA